MAVEFRGTITGTSAARGATGVPFVIQSDVIGLEQTAAALDVLGDKAMHELMGLLYREAEAIKAESMLEVPVDTGQLRMSATLLKYPDSVTVSYGNATVNYALRQHEDLSFRHTVGHAKFLERPYKRHVSDLDARLARDARIIAGV